MVLNNKKNSFIQEMFHKNSLTMHLYCSVNFNYSHCGLTLFKQQNCFICYHCHSVLLQLKYSRILIYQYNPFEVLRKPWQFPCQLMAWYETSQVGMNRGASIALTVFQYVSFTSCYDSENLLDLYHILPDELFRVLELLLSLYI